MRMILASALATTLMVSSALAATQTAVPLPDGKPAGVKQATLLGPSLFLVFLSAGIVIGGLVLSTTNGNKNTVTSPTTTSTSGTP